MKRIFYCFLIVLIGWPIGVYSDDVTGQWLSKLDKSLANRDAYEQKRVDRIDALKKQLSQLDKKRAFLYSLYFKTMGSMSPISLMCFCQRA